MPNVTSIFGLLEKLESTDIAVRQNRCVVVRNRNATCRRCAEACTSGCISMAENELLIAPDKCVGCGTCATVCPTCALEAQHPTDQELLTACLAATQAAEGEAIIACTQITEAAHGLFDPEKVCAVTCLGRVEESLIASLAQAGASHISLVKAKCAECPQASGVLTAELVCATANTLFSTWNSPVKADLVEKFPACARLAEAKGYDYDKRGFFSGLREDAKAAAAKTTDYAVKEALGVQDRPEPRYEKVQADGTLPHFVPERRTRLLEALAAQGTPQDIMIETRLWGHVVIDSEKCSSCQMCATFCPTGAIAKFQDADGTFGVTHAPGLCVKCRCCTDICPKDALMLSDEVFAIDLLEGVVERHVMAPIKNPPGGPHSIWHSMRDLLACDQVYER
ncbi:MAG: 4Fe-4S binding protein [Coriobacteriaceae bacterium]|jgi:Pyruvate/2-oxoacid:ferredoxin oxidoreductase delta subunit|nr:4Fe-4S binding protein [Coriobacteriaceae bacterium]